MSQFEQIVNSIREKLDGTNQVREIALKECREIIRLSSKTIRAVHREEIDDARSLLAETREKAHSVVHLLRDFPEVYHAGYIHDSQKEYVEAAAMVSIISDRTIPLPENLGMEPAAYLNGLAEAGSECRRYVLDRLKAGEFEIAEEILSVMDEIYFELITVDYPDAITGGLRRTTDAFRAVLERTRGDLTLTFHQQKLQKALDAATNSL